MCTGGLAGMFETAASRTESDRKLGELILYIADKSLDDPQFGAVKLNKLLYYADFLFYGQFGRSITGAEYMKLEMGPAPRRLVPVRQDLLDAHELVIHEEPLAIVSKPRQRYVPTRRPELGLFTAEEIAIVDSVIEAFWGQTGTDLSNLTHGYRGWVFAKNLRDTIPYPSVFLSDEPPTEYEKQRALALIQEHGWNV
jgi:hypothetical protein